MLNRRELLKLSGAVTAASFLPGTVKALVSPSKDFFRFCLNTSTISGQKTGLVQYIEIAAKAGYDGLELWVNDIKDYLKQGGSLETLVRLIKDKGLVVENAISFTEWMTDNDARRKAAITELEEEMKMMAILGCHRIAAPPAGVEKGEPIDFQKAGIRYREILVLGRKYNVMPLMEFWGASDTVYNLSQAVAIATAANDRDARILPDVYHLFRGGSGFDGLKLLSGNAIEIIHFNDYPASIPVNEQTDSDRVYPGDGVAPLKEILRSLKAMGGTKVLSLELFNKKYWAQDALLVAKTGLGKMKKIVKETA
jgi:sugar phosphate isomerase/epimerase